jgi:hypothetical protein
MNTIAFIFALLFAFILTALLVTLFSGGKKWKGYWPFFVLILLVALAAGFWATPIGPVFYGYYWLPGLITALIFTLLIATTIPRDKKTKKERGKEKEDTKKNITPTTYYSPHAAEPHKGVYQNNEPIGNVALSGFFWMIIFLLIVIIIAGLIIDKQFIR